jgi:PDZ domain-containing protein
MMFALGIVDKLTPGEMTGGEVLAGTGTIDSSGQVGPIGGIRQKLWGADEAGADWFLAPASNCDEVTGHVPDGMRVFAVKTLDEARSVVEAIGDGEDTSAFASCPAA